MRNVALASPDGVSYVLNILAVVGLVFLYIAGYTLCKNRGYQMAWMGAIPPINEYALGGVADNISYYRGKKTHFRIWMLAGNLSLVLVAILLAMALTGFRVVCQVFRFIALYHIYRDDAPPNAVVFLVLSVLFASVNLDEIFLFVIRNKYSTSLPYAPRS